uniref:Uncharacterized protein n=1 Tax=Cairina moschata TaxID=8855 RepID=A0A8C3GNP9_CAIMO
HFEHFSSPLYYPATSRNLLTSFSENLKIKHAAVVTNPQKQKLHFKNDLCLSQKSQVWGGVCLVRGIIAKTSLGFQDSSYPRGTGNITTRQPPPPTRSNEIQQFIMSSLAAECCV